MKKFLLSSLVCVLAVAGVYTVWAATSDGGGTVGQTGGPIPFIPIPHPYHGLNLSHLMVGNKTGSDQKLTVAMWDELVGHVESGSRNFFNAYIGLLEEISTIKEGLEACNFNYVRHQGNWSDCSKECGNGVQERSVYCMKSSDGTVVNDLLCNGSKPSNLQTCNPQACPTYYWSSTDWSYNAQNPVLGTSWSSCNRTCGGGTQTRTCTGFEGTKTRTVTCKNSSGTTVSNTLCNSATKPVESTGWNSKELCGTQNFQTCQTCKTEACGQCTSNSQCPGGTCVGVTFNPGTCKACGTNGMQCSVGEVLFSYNLDTSKPFLAFDWKQFLGVAVYAVESQCGVTGKPPCATYCSNLGESTCKSNSDCYWSVTVNTYGTCQGVTALSCPSVVTWPPSSGVPSLPIDGGGARS